MKKRILRALILAFAMAALSMTAALAADVVDSGTCGADGDNVTWTLTDDGTLTISGTGEMADYEWVNERTPVNAPWSSYVDTTIKTVIIENGVTSVGGSAFLRCTALTSITIPDGVTSIGDNAFQDCTALTGITIPTSVASIGVDAFLSCTSLASVTLLEGITSIGVNAFNRCIALTDFTIPNTVTSISAGTFSDCTSLSSITIPDSVTSIGGSAFYNCPSLSSITIPDGITSIDEYTFSGCDALTSITIPGNVTFIGAFAFSDCTSLTRITIPDGVTTVDSKAFQNCIVLTSVTIPDSVASIGNDAFWGCDELSDVYFGGTKEQWDKITIEPYNDDLLAATIHYSWVETPVPEDGLFDVSDYAGGAYPTQIEAVFAGWYADEACTTPYTEDSGAAYAKFVDAAATEIKWQITSGTTAESASTDLRLITTIDTLNFQNVGFVIQFGDSGVIERTSSTVYASIKGWEDGAVQEYKPSEFSDASRWFMIYRFNNIGNGDFDTPFTVTSFWTTLDGTRVSGTTRTFRISDDPGFSA